MKKMNKQMNIFLWIIQILLALYFIGGGVYMVSHYTSLVNIRLLHSLPNQTWMVLGVLQVLLALGLLLPGIVKMQMKVIAFSAAALSVISLLGIAVYSAYTGIGSLWGILPAIILAFIAYKRR